MTLKWSFFIAQTLFASLQIAASFSDTRKWVLKNSAFQWLYLNSRNGANHNDEIHK